jgi:glutaminase
MKKIYYMIFAIIIAMSAAAHAAYTLPADAGKTIKNQLQKYRNDTEGKNADYIPELAKVNSDLFAIVIYTVDGKKITAGDVKVPFAIESISKPFVYALALADDGEADVTRKVGLNATGRKFNSITALEDSPGHLENPLVNAGAIQITSLIKGKDSAAKWQRVFDMFQKLSDGKVYLGDAVFQSEMATNGTNRKIAALLSQYHMMYGDGDDAVERYTKACSIMVTAEQLALMGATLANGGVNPLTHQRVFSNKNVRDVLSEMSINGLYENSGAWWFNVGLPAKSGVGGGIVAVVPGKMAIVVFSPRLDDAGNSVRAQKVIQELSEKWKLHLLD